MNSLRFALAKRFVRNGHGEFLSRDELCMLFDTSLENVNLLARHMDRQVINRDAYISAYDESHLRVCVLTLGLSWPDELDAAYTHHLLRMTPP